MKLFATLCVLGVVATGLAMPQHGERPQTHPRPPMHPGHPGHHDLDFDFDHPHIGPELFEFIGHIYDFMQLIPRREIHEIIRNHMQDPELRATLEFMDTYEFHEILHTMCETPELQAIAEYFEEAAWPWIRETIKRAARDMQIEGSGVAKRTVTGGLNALIDAIVAVLPKEQLRALFDEKMENSEVFRSVVEILTSDQLMSLVDSAKQSPIVREQAQKLLANGIDLDKIMKSSVAVFGF